jgi:hypothetical protein
MHRLVAMMFIPNPLNLPQVGHIDKNEQNNKASNLKWVTAKENVSKSIMRKPHYKNRFFTDEQLNEIVKMRDSGKKFTEIADFYDVPDNTICIYYKRMKQKIIKNNCKV